MPSKKVPAKTQIKRVTKPRKSKPKGIASATSKSAVHRNLSLVSPRFRGSDVKQLQKEVAKGLAKLDIDWIECDVDGVLGPQTVKACAFYGWARGIQNKYRVNIKKGHISLYSQRWLRGSIPHSKADRRRQKLRARRLGQIRESQHSGAAEAVRWALSKVGTKEIGTSNRGPEIDQWQQYFGILGEPWCGCFAGYAVKKIGEAKVTSWLPYGPSIINDARSNANGLTLVSPENAKPGDLVVYWNGEHIGLIRELSKNGYVITVEGNTSGSGSQSNGGEVALKERPFSDVTVVARPQY